MRRLDLHNNQIGDLNNLRVLTYNKNLVTIDFKGNPVSKVVGFRRLVLNLLPLVTNLDAMGSRGEVEPDISTV